MTQTAEAPPPVPAELRVGTGEAATIAGVHPRTIERYVDNGTLRGGRLIDPVTREEIPRSWRWVHIEDVVAMAFYRGLSDRIPAQWRHLIPQPVVPQQPSGS
jgi:hypothetical protein